MPLVVFITTFPDTRFYKRVIEFKNNGFNIEAYTFIRKNVKYNEDSEIKIYKLNVLPQNYIFRAVTICKDIISIKKKIPISEDTIYYYFGLDVAIIGLLFNRNKYLYEEADLVQGLFNNSMIRKIIDILDKRVIKSSIETIFTSEGFIDYHFENNIPKNISVIPNRLDKRILEYNIEEKKKLCLKNLRIGFVGFIRYDSIINFADVFSLNFPTCEFHFYGIVLPGINIKFLLNRPNIYFHGGFTSPDDLSNIYYSFDLLLATYDINSINVKFAEPNKLYEAIYFRTPIIVSDNTFLSSKVKKYKIGYSINALDSKGIIDFVSCLTKEDIESKINNCRNIPTENLINSNSDFFQKIYNYFKD